MDDKKIVPMHKEARHLYEVVITPEHVERSESAEFRASKKRLKDDGHFKCWICGTEEDLQVHHFGCEWSLENVCDFDKLKQFCEEWDPYGYGHLLRNKPIISADDVRNMLVLCQEHHTGVNEEYGGSGTGIHSMTFPAFIMQKIAKKDGNPIPQDGQKSDDMIIKDNK